MSQQYDFQNKAILCSEWSQMEALAKLAEAHGLPVRCMSKECFKDMPYFMYSKSMGHYSHYSSQSVYDEYTRTDYATFMHPDAIPLTC